MLKLLFLEGYILFLLGPALSSLSQPEAVLATLTLLRLDELLEVLIILHETEGQTSIRLLVTVELMMMLLMVMMLFIIVK